MLIDLPSGVVHMTGTAVTSPGRYPSDAPLSPENELDNRPDLPHTAPEPAHITTKSVYFVTVT